MKLGAGFWLTSLGFNAYWTLAVLWRERGFPLLLVGAALALAFTPAKQRKWVLLAALLGIAMDALWCYIGLFAFSGQNGVPLWMCALWLTFACWWCWLLSRIRLTLPILVLLGAVSGPLAYAIGWQLNAMVPQLAPEVMLLALACAWAIYLPAISWLMLRGRTPS
ncbi:DUF2878 domain-containing protein [Serratia oryzae]|uniref:DUF2878 domain-containing protein n=1 Tax=Serratia oryzae TaxID=2034155 RepID=UPI0012E1F6FE|nr:DUF2878 domain-containing protein [Serratia oryzae]